MALLITRWLHDVYYRRKIGKIILNGLLICVIRALRSGNKLSLVKEYVVFSNFFRKKPDYEKIFSSEEEVKKHIYGDKAKTSSVLGDQDFINAWLDSKNFGKVTAVIEAEAMKGDIPSLKQMIWISDVYCEDVPNMFSNPQQILEQQTIYLLDRVKYCVKAMDCGLKEQSYYALTSSVKICNLYGNIPGAIENPIFQNSLSNIIKFAEIFINSGTSEHELVQDAKNAIEYYSPMAKLLSAK